MFLKKLEGRWFFYWLQNKDHYKSGLNGWIKAQQSVMKQSRLNQKFNSIVDLEIRDTPNMESFSWYTIGGSRDGKLDCVV